jgi:tRNA-dihydrouridine synthase A
VVERMAAYLVRETAAGEAPRHVVRHVLGLYQGVRGARQWRRLLSDADLLASCGAGILGRAMRAVEVPRAQAA